MAGRTLRGLARAAATLDNVVDSYDHRFEIGVRADEKRDPAAFLRAL